MQVGGSKMGLREQKKEKTKNAILKYSKKKFVENGYKKVTTAEIAKALEIGEGTLFNYFNSKGQLFVECLLDVVDFDLYTFDESLMTDENEVTVELMKLIDVYLKSLNQLDKNLLVEYISVLYDVSSKGKTSGEVVPFIDEHFLKRIKDIFNSLKVLDKFSSDIDEENLSYCVLSCIITQFTLYVYDDQKEYSDMMNNLKIQISLILKGNLLRR